jgi:hypothetical protein
MQAALENRRKVVIESLISPFKRKNILRGWSLMIKSEKNTRQQGKWHHL